jgi:hypothetical protein
MISIPSFQEPAQVIDGPDGAFDAAEPGARPPSDSLVGVLKRIQIRIISVEA